MSMLVIGITGPTGCGKTTLLQQIERRGGHIVDCDALYYALLASKEGAALRQELQTAFPDAFGADGGLRRKALGQLVFGDKARMAQLNEIVFFHVGNAVRARLVRERAAGRRLFAIDAINLFESGLAALCDTTVGVLAGRETRIARIMARDGLTQEYAALRVDAQNPDSFYESHCGTILQNAGTREQFARTADQYLTNILKGAFPMTKQEREALLYQPRHGRDRLTKEDEAAMLTYCEDYKAFLDRSKTERECVVSAVELAEKAGFRELMPLYLYLDSLAGDPEALALWREFGGHVGQLVMLVLYTYDPEAIVFGGSIAHAFGFFREAMYEQLKRFPYAKTVEGLHICCSNIDHVGLLGASACE